MSDMGMDKSSTQNLSSNNVWVKVTGWTVRTGFPATVITNNSLVMDQARTGTVTWRGAFVFATGTQQFRAVLNGTPVGAATNNGIVGTQTMVSVQPGDTLDLEAFASVSFADTVNSGAANTYIYFEVTSTPHTGEATQSIGWDRSAEIALSTDIAAADTAVAWDITAETIHSGQIPADRGIAWDITADIYQGIHYDADAEVTIGWDIEADMALIPDVTSLPPVFADTEMAVSVHTADGRGVGDFPCNMVANYTFGRETAEVSTASIQIHTQGDPELVEELRQWVHWVTLWLGDQAVWTGPIWNVRIGRTITTISARDPSIFLWRTRTPITRTFTDTAPARIADTVWRVMNQLHGIRAAPLVLPGIVEETFTVSATADSRMLHQFIDELVKVGLQWTVVSGRVVLGEFPRAPVAELQECDFLVEIERQRDGSQTFNDVRLQGQNWAATAVADLGGLRLQGLVSMDDMFGSSNIQRAARQYAREVARLRDDLVVPASASLHPSAPVTFDDLIPGKAFAVFTDTAQQLMRLDQVTVSGTPDSIDVQVTLITLQDDADIELIGGTR